MKKRKLLIPFVTMIGAITPVLAVATGCQMVKPQTLNINKEGILLGFKEGTTNDQIKRQFGNTMTIPKEVTYIAPYAFVNVPNAETTIPDFIENFTFEEGYKCEEIGQMAFAYAPFKSVKIENERRGGLDPEQHNRSWARPYDPATGKYTGWGLKKIDARAFYKTENLEYLKLCASIESLKVDVRPNDAILGWETDNPDCPWTSNLKTIDVSDWLPSATELPELDPLPGGFIANTKISVMYDESFDQNCHVIYRTMNGVDGDYDSFKSGQDNQFVAHQNKFREWLGANIMPSPSPVIGRLTFKPVDVPIDHMVEDATFGNCLSSYGGNYYTNPYYNHFNLEVDLANWSGNLPSQWVIALVNSESTPYPIANNTELSLWLNEQKDENKLVAGTDYNYADGAIIGTKALKKTDKLLIQFGVTTECLNGFTLFGKAN